MTMRVKHARQQYIQTKQTQRTVFSQPPHTQTHTRYHILDYADVLKT